MENNLIKSTLSSIKDERIVIDKIISANERDDNLSFVALQEIFKDLRIKTDSLISKVADEYSLEDLKEGLLKSATSDTETSFDKFTLFKLVDYELLERLKSDFVTVDSIVFDEEHFKYLYNLYMWYIKNNELTDSNRKSLHKFMLLKSTGSQVLRSFFSGDYDCLEKISNPEVKYGAISSEVMSKFYSSLFNSTLCDAKCNELFNNLFKKETIFESNKKFTTLQFAAISLQMMDRNITLEDCDYHLSDFMLDIISDASSLSDKYKKEKDKFNSKIIVL